MREISFEEQTVNSANPLARFAHRSRMSTAIGLVSRLCRERGTVFDFGVEPGLFLQSLGEARPDVSLIGHDLSMQSTSSRVKYVESLASVAARSVDVLTAFEVCEHLRDDELDALLADAARILRPDGAFVISVPIMYGLALAPKVSNWMIRNRSLHSEYSPAEFLKAMLGIGISRPADPRDTHKGFDFRALRDTVSQHFMIDETRMSPVSQAPWWLSSQFFMTCRQKAQA